MRARRGLIPSRFLVLLLPLILSCSGGGSETTQSVTAPPSPPAPAGLLYRTDAALIRSQTDGSGQVILDEDHAGIWSVLVSGSSVTYMFPQVPSVVNHEDLWTVQTNGTDRHPLVRDPNHETYLRDVIGSWVLYDYRSGQSFMPPPPSLASVRLDGTDGRIIMEAVGAGELWQAPNYERQADGRAIIEFAGNLFSLLPDGTDLRQLTVYPPFPHLNNEAFTSMGGVRGVVGNRAIYSTSYQPFPFVSAIDPAVMPKLSAVSVVGGPIVALGDGPEYELLGAVTDTRVVYNRCVLMFLPNLDVTFDYCNVSSVRSDGQGRVALTDTHDINYVQGVIGQQVIIRRSQRGGTIDDLFSIPVSGGAETPLLTLAFDNEFVRAIVDSRIILQRTTGLWSIKADGSELVQLTPEATPFTSIGAAGPFACFNRGLALWCVPADGSGPATQVTDHGTFVTGL